MNEGEYELDFNRRAVRPVECLREGWQLIKDDYWLFLGICLVGALIGQFAPLGILSGPMMCGINICLLRRMRGQQVTFDMLFRGFQHFVPSMLVGLVPMVLVLVTLPLYYIGFFASMLVLIPGNQQGGPPGPAALALFLGLQMLLALMLMVPTTFVAILIMFACPLIAEHDLTAAEALRLSARAAWANLVGMFALMLLIVLMSMVGLMACYVGAIFLLPLSYAAFAVAYRQVFPLNTTEYSREFDIPEEQLLARDPAKEVLLIKDAIQPAPDERSLPSHPGPNPEPGIQQTGIQGEPARDPPM